MRVGFWSTEMQAEQSNYFYFKTILEIDDTEHLYNTASTSKKAIMWAMSIAVNTVSTLEAQ